MVICYFEKKTFVYIHLIFTLCANLQYISDHLKSNSSSASPSLTLGIPQCRSRGLRPQGRRDQLHPLWRGPLLNMTWVIEYPCGCSWKPSPCLSSSVIASSPAPAIRPTRRGDLPSLSGTLIRPLLSLHTHWIPDTKAHHISGDWWHWPFWWPEAAASCSTVQPQSSLSLQAAPLLTSCSMISVLALAAAKWSGDLWGGPVLKPIMRILLKFDEITWSRDWPRPRVEPGPGQADPETPPGGAGSESGHHAHREGSHPAWRGLLTMSWIDFIWFLPQLIFPVSPNYYPELLDELHRPLLSRFPPLLRLMQLH